MSLSGNKIFAQAQNYHFSNGLVQGFFSGTGCIFCKYHQKTRSVHKHFPCLPNIRFFFLSLRNFNHCKKNELLLQCAYLFFLFSFLPVLLTVPAFEPTNQPKEMLQDVHVSVSFWKRFFCEKFLQSVCESICKIKYIKL